MITQRNRAEFGLAKKVFLDHLEQAGEFVEIHTRLSEQPVSNFRSLPTIYGVGVQLTAATAEGPAGPC